MLTQRQHKLIEWVRDAPTLSERMRRIEVIRQDDEWLADRLTTIVIATGENRDETGYTS